jgi:myo-inositol 2-dehydrogenase / D-chiro-inositol 1-dehydrogenase
MSDAPSTNRRDFLKTSTVALAGTALTGAISRGAYAAGSDEIKFALVGCGGRGTGAADHIMNTKGNTKLVSVADAFQEKADDAVSRLLKIHGDKLDLPGDRIFAGLDAYKKAIDESECDLVVLATPPGFRPEMFEYAVQKGKHVFMEKPVAVDAPGVRKVLAATEEAKKKNLMVGVGLQRRHEPQYMETVKRIHDGAIGDVILSRVYWNGGGIWYRDRQSDQNEMEFQVNNWYHFIWLSGDQICEQHIHNLDVGCWVKDAYPVECNGMGGGERRMDGDRTKSQIFDHTFCEYTFPDGTKMYSQGRHLANSYQEISEFVHGTKGTADPSGRITSEGEQWRYRGERVGGHQQEQHDLIEALMRGEIYNEGEYGAKSTFTAILGREACYSGKVVKWDELLEKGRTYAPGIEKYTVDSQPPVVPGPDGKYPAPLPGLHNPFEGAATPV